MDEMITLSSDDSDVEIVGSFSEFTTKTDPLPLSEVRVDIEAVNVNIPPRFIDLTDPRWAFPELKLRKTPVIDLTENSSKETELETENLPSEGGFPSEKDCKDTKTVCFLLNSKQSCLNSPAQHVEQNHTAHPCQDTPAVKLTRLPFLETHVSELKTGCSVQLTNEPSQMSLYFRHPDDKREAQECIDNLRTATALNVSHMGSLVDEGPPEVEKSATDQQESGKEPANAQVRDKGSQRLQTPADFPTSEEGNSCATSNKHCNSENEPDGFQSSNHLPSPPSTSSFPDKAQREVPCSNQEQMDQAESRQSCPSDQSSLHSPATRLTSSERYEPVLPEWEMETETYRGDMGMDSPSSLLWQGGSDGEESRFGMDFRAVSREDRQFVCPDALGKVMSGPTQALIREGIESFGTSEVLCRQSLSLVYSTIEENYPEGTLQLLSDLLQPGYYPPKDITTHLLCGILLDPVCPHHLCLQAFNLLMRTQRHHIASKRTVPWDWELLTSVMSNQDRTKKHRCEAVRMFLDYIVQTLEDDFHAKCSSSGAHHSIAKATLSCDQQFTRVRDVIKWLFSAIMKSTEHGKSKETTREKDEHMRIVTNFQRMLSLALKVDRSPALNSAKLSQELFHALLSHLPLRAQRMLLLESLESKLLRCKLLEHLLDYACPQKTTLPMSLSLLLHFLKNCALAPDPTDGPERWQKWEELIHLLWMLLLSYNKAMEGYLCSSNSEQRSRTGTLVYRPDDMILKPAVREAVEAFLSRSRADLGQALPLHVEESLTYLQDHLLDVCQR
ncbi:uncharacterized protein simc1 [Leuresthes tenuis]|uniref:uncharacterized protein simc1 n=1 Tax=Leuresthes tenuis TaxID=355514 RepID=UPI003B50A958